ncbi:MAG: UDP-N-acetylmuramate--L-alanine ligase [Cytophagaceae bacterium]|nr:UDP-N-acetylmuramate--L-alanine ligase [Cytophagaceae bacterium]MDW8455417.1 UDP-N-acetylmuramate--L-alanine ligase [Cytophagaceae bacterium]
MNGSSHISSNNIKIDHFSHVYFVGIGGIGMSALARWCNAHGKHTAGYDKTSTALTKSLIDEGISITYIDDVQQIPESYRNTSHTLVVYTPAVPQDSSLMQYFTKHKYTMIKRAQLLGILTKENFTIAIAGTHGKTTTTSMIAHILKSAGKKISAFLGGISVNYNTNLLLDDNSNINVVEADEYDRSFLNLSPDISVITSADADHLDVYANHEEVLKSFSEFAHKIKPNGLLIVKQGLNLLLPTGVSCFYYDYAQGHAHAQNVHIENGHFVFDYCSSHAFIRNIKLLTPGHHNVENAVAAISVAIYMGIEPHAIQQAIESFKGVKRRFEYICQSEKHIYIDDYAHHPQELSALLTSVKDLYPTKTIVCIFQPHLYTRTRDFYVDFAQSLSLAHIVYLLDIYPAREKPIEGISSQIIYDRIQSSEKYLVHKEELLEKLNVPANAVVLTAGAGDIDTMVEKIRNKLMHA